MLSRIDIDTKMIALFGKPLGFSFAARMQNAAYDVMGLNMIYFYCEVEEDGLPDVLAAVRRMNFAGCAVTKPNKVEVMRYLDEVDDLCAKMGASNTVVKLPDGRLKGYNTDGMGFYRSVVEETDLDVKGSTFLFIGAGGAGRACASAVAYHGAKRVLIADKIEASARSLVRDINEKIAPCAEFADMSDGSSLRRAIGSADMVANATGLGMIPHEDETPISRDALSKDQICFDATYNPERTRFLREAAEVGCRVLNGVGMNIYQAAHQINLWSGHDAPIDAMRREFAAMLAEADAKTGA